MIRALLTAAALALLLLLALGTLGWLSLRRRNQALEREAYFVGQPIGRAIAELGRETLKYPRRQGCADYVWDTGHKAVMLRCDAQGTVVDYCPQQAGPAVARKYFEARRESLVGLHIQDIKRDIGQPDESGSYDFGLACEVWQIGRRSRVEVWTQSEVCTEAVFKR